MSYFLIESDQDGRIQANGPLNKEQLLERINQSGYTFSQGLEITDNSFAGGRRVGTDLAVVIKGEIIIPQPIEVINRYDVD
jgi:hypothetical protein